MKCFTKVMIAFSSLVVSLFSALILFSCSNPLGYLGDGDESPVSEGGLSVRFSFSGDSAIFPESRSDGLRATIYPTGDPNFFKPDFYEITGLDPGGGWRNFGTIRADQLAQGISGFFEGYWFFEVRAYVDELADPIAAGSTAAAISAGGANTVSLRLDSRIDTSQYGVFRLSLDIQYPLVSHSLTLNATRLKPIGTGPSSISYTLQHDSTHAWLDPTDSTVQAGMYRMDLVLQDGGAVVWGESQIVYIAPYAGPNYIRSVYDRTVTAAEAGQVPQFNPFISLNDGVVVDNGGEGTSLTMSSLDPGAIIVYTLDDDPGAPFGFDFYTGQPFSGCHVYAGPLTLDSDFDESDGALDRLTYIRAAAFNPVGHGPQSFRIYYHSDAIYVAKTTPEAVGTALWPLTDLQEALNRARDLNRSSVTDVRMTVGGYDPSAASGEFTLYGGTRLSGSYDGSGTPWQRSASLPAVSSYNSTNATMLIGNAVGGAAESSATASLRIANSLGKPAFCEYFGVESGTSVTTGNHHAAILADSVTGAVSIDHVKATGGMGSGFYNSYGIIARSCPTVTLSSCDVTGRYGPGSGDSYEATALHAADSGVTLSAATLNTGNGFGAGYNHGLNASGTSAIALNGSLGPNSISGAVIATPGSSRNYGVRVSGRYATAALASCMVSCESGAVIRGVAFEKSRGTVFQSAITIASPAAHAEAVVLFLQAYPDAYADPLAPPDFTVSESTIDDQSTAIATGLSAGIQLKGGKASIAKNALVSGGLANLASGGISYGIDVAPDADPGAWAEAQILQNVKITGRTAHVSAGLHATEQIRLLAESNTAIYSESAGSSNAGSRRYSMYLVGVKKIPGRDGLPMVQIVDTESMFGTEPSGTSAFLYGLSIEATSLSEAILVDKNKISAGTGPSGTSVPSGGVYIGLTGIRKAPLVFRNNIVYAGSGTVPMVKGMYLSCDESTASEARVILANNTIISSTGIGAALTLADYAKPELYNNVFFKQTTGVGPCVEATADSAPLAMQFCSFVNVNTAYLYRLNGATAPINSGGMIQQNLSHAFDELSDLFSSPFVDIGGFSSFKAEYVDIPSLATDRFGGLTLSGTGGPIAPWPFSDDCFSNPRTPGSWSRGANQPTYP